MTTGPSGGEPLGETESLPDAAMDRALALLQRVELTDAEAAYREIVAENPGHSDAWHLLGLTVAQQGRLDEAAGIIRKALSLKDDLPAVHSNLGNVQKLLGRLDDALASYERALALAPDYAEAHSNRGNVLKDLGRDAEALTAYDAAIALAPDFADAHYNRGVALQGLNRFDEALTAYRQAIACAPANAQAHNNMGLVLETLGRRGEALSAYSRASQLRPDYAEAHLHEGFCRLAGGDFSRGWPLYEYRRRLSGMQGPAGRSAARQWSGTPLAQGTTVLLWAEQGLGDTIQFCRYAGMTAERGARVVMEVQPALKSLLGSVPGTAAVCAQGEPVPDFDFHSPLLTVPMLLETGFETIPATVPYIHADPVKVGKFSALLGTKRRPRIGVVWSGNPNPYNHHDHRRSVPPELFGELFHFAAQWVSLQKEVRETDRPMLASSGLADFRHEIGDFSDTAALIESMDLVISIDTSVAHLAGAMGKPVWILLPRQADWRWFLEREDSPWYPTARLFRQRHADEWGDVIERVKAALQTRQ